MLAPDASGLVAAVIVDARDGRVLMLGYMNREALAATASTRKVTFFSRSRQQLWQKGESSGHTLELVSIRVDCDGDALLVQAVPRGPTCHTGTTSCFFKTVELPPAGAAEPVEPVEIAGEDDGPAPTPSAIDSLWQTILDRKAGRGLTNREGKSYVRTLLDGGVERINAKLVEEAGELCDALASETDARVLNEAADLLFHALVGLAARELEPAQVAAVIRERHGLSGVDEKAQR
ncbi:Phosphoribosyl-ATP pyrophosphatase [Enhygromyxa salina]|uniref:Histidine biosynthesis bifunctional protein HisIE n=2 Tax=Enhygromyxa salina TaxID=215803 RepID=A0A2S9YLI6_9BACT|nr:Phosphoribosyl-ATP pyrophosphatase [Enhygromyxa salina]